MQTAHESGSTPSPSWTQRLFGRWWRSQSAARQDRFATLGPLVSVLLFLLAIVAAFWTLRNEEIERATDAVRRDTEVAQQQIRSRLSEDQELMVRLTRDIVTHDVDTDSFFTQTASFAPGRPLKGLAPAASRMIFWSTLGQPPSGVPSMPCISSTTLLG